MTGETEADFTLLMKAIDKIKEVLTEVNNASRRSQCLIEVRWTRKDWDWLGLGVFFWVRLEISIFALVFLCFRFCPFVLVKDDTLNRFFLQQVVKIAACMPADALPFELVEPHRQFVSKHVVNVPGETWTEDRRINSETRV